MSLSAFCPVVQSDFPRFKLLLQSLKVFADGPIFDQFICCVPNRDIPLFSQTFSEFETYKFCSQPLTIVCDDDIIQPNLVQTGWHKQQILKLLIHTWISSDYVCVFDADVLCCSPVSKSTFIKSGRARIQFDQHEGQNVWMQNASKALEWTPPKNTLYMDVTPAILSKHVVKLVCDEFKLDQLVYWISKCEISEYSLYYVTLQKNNLFDKFHFVSPLIAKCSIWYLSEFFGWSFERCMAENVPFTVYQSNIKLLPEIVIAGTHKYLFKDEQLDMPQINCVLHLTNKDWLPIGIRNFQAQTYSNCRLYVVLGNLNEAQFKCLEFDRIHLCKEPSFASGSLVAEWVENTLYHPTRLDVQKQMLGKFQVDKHAFGQQLIFVKNCSLVRFSPNTDSVSLSQLCKVAEDTQKVPSEHISRLGDGLQLLSVYVATDLTDSYIQKVKGQTWESYQVFPLYMQTHRDDFDNQVKKFVERFGC